MTTVFSRPPEAEVAAASEPSSLRQWYPLSIRMAPSKVELPVMVIGVVGEIEPEESVISLPPAAISISSVCPLPAVFTTSRTVYTQSAWVVDTLTLPEKVELPFTAEKPSVSVVPNCNSEPLYDSLAQLYGVLVSRSYTNFILSKLLCASRKYSIA